MFRASVHIDDLMGILDLKKIMDVEAAKAAKNLTAMGHAKAVELAARQLHARRQMFVEGLEMKQVNEFTWFISLNAKATWIEDGMPPHSMLDALLRSAKARTSKDGTRYVVVPFRHGPGVGGGHGTPAQMSLTDTIKSEMKQRGIPYAKVERAPDGSPKMGLLHRFNILNAPLKTAEGPGQGRGAIGAVKQGPTGIPFLRGVGVYQRPGAGGKVQRDIMTFRIASEKHRNQGRWEHPGLRPVKILDQTAEWILQTWEREIAPLFVDRVLSLV